MYSKLNRSCRSYGSQRLKISWQNILKIWCVVFACLVSAAAKAETDITPEADAVGKISFPYFPTQPNITAAGLLELTADENCTPPAIDDFPRDLFTQEERQEGYVAIHFLVSIYMFYCLAVVCDEYFVPSIESFCEAFQLPGDVAGATFMAVATSSQELFTNAIGTFITEGDIGVGTIVGSAVFNILGVGACIGLTVKNVRENLQIEAIQLEWYPLTRDCVFYAISVFLLIYTVNNQQVHWYEALLFVLLYALYILIMYKNTAIRSVVERLVLRKSYGENLGGINSERVPLLVPELSSSVENPDGTISKSAETPNLNLPHSADDNEEEKWSPFCPPSNQGSLAFIVWMITWPTKVIYSLTIPDCRKERFKRWYPLTLIMCTLWIAFQTYIVSWTITVIGYTLSIPDSVMGLTFLAAGNSVPEAVSSVIVARQGLGTMSISNSIGSNTFDILMCLGLPWLIKGSIIANRTEQNYIQINSGGMFYSIVSLLLTLTLFYIVLACNGFRLDRRVGVIALIIYAVYLTFASLTELNKFGFMNLPTCKSIFD